MKQPLSASEISKLVATEIIGVELPEQPERLYDPIRYILSLGGKRIRPLLAFMSNNLFTDSFTAIMQPALSIEIFHNFSLVHDDIMDKAPAGTSVELTLLVTTQISSRLSHTRAISPQSFLVARRI